MAAKRIACLLLLFALLLFLPGLIVEADGQGCSVATLNGAYGDLEEGMVVGEIPGLPPLPPGVTLPSTPFPTVLSGVITFDGAGHVSATYTASFAGLAAPGFASGTYEVSPDCTYSDEITPAEGVVSHHVGTITGQGISQELQVTYTNDWLVATGTAKKMASSPCSLATLKGSFGNLELGWLWTSPPVSLALSATATYDGAGHLSGTATLNGNGQVETAPYTAKYTVNPDCTYSDEITFSDETLHRVGTITGGGTHLEVETIYTDPGVVALGTLKTK